MRDNRRLCSLGLFPALALAAVFSGCKGDQESVGGADLTMHVLAALEVTSVEATVTGPALSGPKTFQLSRRDSSSTWGALIGSLPVGSNYLFSVKASDHLNTVNYAGSAAGIAIVKDAVTTVVITAELADSASRARPVPPRSRRG